MGEDYVLTAFPPSAPPDHIGDLLRRLIGRVYDQMTGWNVRLGEQLSIVFSCFDKPIFNILNSLIAMYYLWLIDQYAFAGRERADRTGIEMLIAACVIILLQPALGEIFFWRTGGTNYLWAICILLTFGLPIRYFASVNSRDIIGDSKLKITLLTVIGFFAGFTNENTVGAFLALYIGVLLYHFVKKKGLPCWIYTSFCSLLAGFIFMLKAPSTANRIRYYNEALGIGSPRMTDYIARVPSVTFRFFSDNGCLVLLTAICILAGVLCWNRCKNGEEKLLPHLEPFGWLLLMGVLSCGALIMSPYVETRSFLLADFMMVMCIVYYSYLFFSTFKTQTLFYAAAALLFVLTIPCMGRIYNIYQAYNDFCIQRTAAIALSREETFIWEGYAGPCTSRILTTREDYCTANSSSLSYYFQRDIQTVPGYIVGGLTLDDYSREEQCLGGVDYANYDPSTDDFAAGGWLVLPDAASEDNEIYIYFETDAQRYYFRTNQLQRPDVVEYLGDKRFLYSGFQINVQRLTEVIGGEIVNTGVCVVNREGKVYGEISIV